MKKLLLIAAFISLINIKVSFTNETLIEENNQLILLNKPQPIELTVNPEEIIINSEEVVEPSIIEVN